MTEQEALAKMIAPGQLRDSKWRQGVIQIWVTHVCDKACFSCTQGSNLHRRPEFMSLEHFEQACISLKDYFGVVGMFGGNPATHPQFVQLCEIMREHIPAEQRGIWCNNPLQLYKAQEMKKTFNPSFSNLNVHLDQKAYNLFKEGWPECNPVGLTGDSRHSPPFVAMKNVLKKKCENCDGSGHSKLFEDRNYDQLPFEQKDYYQCPDCKGTGEVYDEEKGWELISNCDINKYWSAMIGVFRGQLRAWFCEIAGAQSMLHQNDPNYPDTGMSLKTIDVLPIQWWQRSIYDYVKQVRKHCHECGVPLRGHGQLSQSTEDKEQVSEIHATNYTSKRIDRKVEIVTELVQLGVPLQRVTSYIQNGQVK